MGRPNPLRVHFHYALYLLRMFRWPIAVFLGLVIGGGTLFYLLYHHDPPLSYVEACYFVFMLIFTEVTLDDFPEEWYLQPFLFIVPIVGLGAVADSVVRLAYLVFTRKSRLPDWNRLVASLYDDHIVLIGLGKLGREIAAGLDARGRHYVVVDVDPDHPHLEKYAERGVPCLREDGRLAESLELAGIRRARGIVLATNDDLANLDAALTARDVKPDIQVTMRMFDDTLATKFAARYDVPVLSAARLSAPAFIARAIGHRVYQQFRHDGRALHVMDIRVEPGGGLVGLAIGELQTGHTLNVVYAQGEGGRVVNPPESWRLAPDETIVVIATIEELVALRRINRNSPLASDMADPRPRALSEPLRDHVIVVGAGRIGYRIAQCLLDLEHPLLLLDRQRGGLLVEELLDRDVPFIRGDARQSRALVKAGVEHAKAIILATSDDLANLDAALTAQELNPAIRIVVRLFDQTLADKFESSFGIPTISTPKHAAPAFVAAATGRRLIQEIRLEDAVLHLADYDLEPGDPREGMTVGEFRAERGVTVVWCFGVDGEERRPDDDRRLKGGDALLVMTDSAEALRSL